MANRRKTETTKKRHTDLSVAQLNPPKAGHTDHWDTTQAGLFLRVRSSGAKSWVTMYRVAGTGKQVKETLGRFPLVKVAEARRRAAASMEKAGSGVNPVAERREATERAAANTVTGAVERYLRHVEHDRKRRPATLKGYRQIFYHDVLPAWGNRPVASITDGDVLVLLNKKKSSRERKREGETGAGIQANRVLTRLRTFFAWCMAKEQKLIAVDPTAGIAPPVQENQRDRVLTEDELKAFWTATGALDAKREGGIPCGALFRLLLLTAQRKSEVGGMRFREIDIAKSQWTIPKERTKNGKEHFVHLSDLAMEVLNGLPQDRDLIFSGISGGRTTAPNFAWAKSCVDAEMRRALPKMTPWVLHDLRRTATTVMAGQLKIAPHVADKVLNHTAGTIKGVAAIYNRFEYLDERRDALEALGRYVLNLVEPDGAGNVVPLRTA